MNRIVFTELAEDDLIDIWVNIAVGNEAAADRLVNEIHALACKLVEFPKLGRAADHLRAGARLFVHCDYLVVYRPMESGIAVLRVTHGARDLGMMGFPNAPEE